MMKMMTMKRMALCTLAMLALGGAKMSAATETYDFTGISTGRSDQKTPTYLDGDYATNIKKLGSQTAADASVRDFGGRFALTDASINGWKFRDVDANNKGLWAQYQNKSDLYILNMVRGDKVTIVYGNDNMMQVDGGSDIANNTAYTATADGDLHLVAKAAGVYIHSITIETYEPVASEKVTVGVIGYESTINFKNESTANPTAIDPLTSSDDTVFDRLAFAGTVKLTDVTFTENYGLKILWASKLLTVKNLKAGETFTINFTTTGLNISGTSILDGVADDGTLTSGQEYTVKADGNLVLDNQGKNTTIESIVISKATWNTGGSTLVSANALDFTGLDIYAYVATAISGNTVTFSKVEKVPANTPLFLTAAEAVSVDVPVLDGAVETITTNYLKGSATEATVLDPTDAATYYIYGVNNNVAGFYKLAGESGTISSAAGKAYLEVPASLAPSFLNISFGGGTTAIEDAVKSDELREKSYYNLAGQRVAQPTKGLYIVNGKKVVYKEN